MIRMVDDRAERPAAAVVGVGGAGSKVLNTLIETGMNGTATISVVSDAASLEQSGALERLLVGKDVVGGRGCGGDPEKGRLAVRGDLDLVKEALEEYGTVILVGGLGGGTAAGGLPEIASLAAESGMRVLAVVTQPLPYEGKRKKQMADRALADLRDAAGGVVNMPNEALLSAVEEGDSIVDAFFERMNGSVCRAVHCLLRLLEGGGIINADFADILSVLSREGTSAIGYGRGEGARRALDAATEALASSMLRNAPFGAAAAALLLFEGSSTVTYHDISRALDHVSKSAAENADIITCAFVDEKMGESCTATIVAAGLGGAPQTSPVKKEEKSPKQRKPVKTEQTMIDFSAPDRGRFADLEPSLYNGEDLDIPTILRRKMQ